MSIETFSLEFAQLIQAQGAKFNATIEAVKALKRTIENGYESGIYTAEPKEFRRCCDVDDEGWEIDYRFKRMVITLELSFYFKY